MRVNVNELIVGDRLLSSVFNDKGLHVMPGDKILDAEDIEKLKRHKIEYVDIALRENFDLYLETRNTRIEEIIQEVQPKFDNAVNGMKSLFEQVMNEGKIDESIVEQTFAPLIEHFQSEHDVVSLLLALTSKDDYTYQHCVQVGMISYYIARWIGLDESEALLVGKAGYLHDIGKGQISTSILNKPAKLTVEEFEIMKCHTTFGHNIISRSLPHEREIGLVALQHHERLNGSGYPGGITETQIHPYSKIVAVADVYSAMISSRVYQKKKDLLFVLRELFRLSFAELDPYIVHTFIQKMTPQFIGKKLVLVTGETGDIVLNNPSDPFRPLIRLGNQFIDLSKHHELIIDTIYV